MKHCLFLLATLVLAVGCKTDGESAKAESTAPAAEQSANSGRSGKIDLPQRRRPTAPDGDGSAAGERKQPERPFLTDEERMERRQERRAQRMAEQDKNGDGTIDESERLAIRQERMTEMRSRMDTDGDGKLTVDELKNSRASRRFGDISAMDTDKNGEISNEEMQKQMEEMRAQGWGRRGGWRGGRDGEPDGPAQPGQPAQPETK